MTIEQKIESFIAIIEQLGFVEKNQVHSKSIPVNLSNRVVIAAVNTSFQGIILQLISVSIVNQTAITHKVELKFDDDLKAMTKQVERFARLLAQIAYDTEQI